jgi:beta-glucosidase
MTRMRWMAAFLVASWAVLSYGAIALAADEPTPVYKDPKAPLEARVDDLLKRLTMAEKLDLLGGTGFGTKPIERLGLPAMGMCDGPVGVRGGGDGTTGPATVFPCGIAMAATWDPVIVQRIGTAIGRELINKGPGSQVILGPCVCIHRTPLGGRNGESFSEDPYLAARTTVAYVEGVQSTGAASCIKHYACNNQEWERGSINVRVDERALREIYLPAFRAAVEEAHVRCIMNAYNCVNGPHCSANTYLLTDVLKDEWGFDGCVMTDWGAAHNTLGCALGGTDLEMPTGAFMNPQRLSPLMAQGKISPALIDDKVRRIVRTIIRVGLLDPRPAPDNSVVDCQAHRDLVRQAGARSIVLLKNEGNILPLDMKKLHSIAVIGPNAAENRTSMGGSGYVAPAHNVSALEALRARAGDAVTINYAKGSDMGDEALPAIPAEALTPAEGPAGQHGLEAGQHGLRAEYFANQDLQGEPAVVRTDAAVNFNWVGGTPDPKIPHDHFSARWTGKLVPAVSGEYKIGAASDDGSRVFLDGKLLIDNWRDHAVESVTTRLTLQAGHEYDLRVEYYQSTGDAAMILGWRAPNASPEHDPMIDEAVAAAAKSDVAIVFAGLSSEYEGEGQDRTDLELPGSQNALIKAVAAANKNTVVVLTNGTPLMIGGWLAQTPAVLEAWYLGGEGGNSVADVLLGDVNPSGRLPDTLAARREDYPDFGHYPGSGGQVEYAEGIFVGYRHFDKDGIAPLFPFGYGLSYTTFEYRDLSVSPTPMAATGKTTVSLTVRNTGKRAGEEVVQLYIHDPKPQIEKAVRELKRFAKVALRPGESKTVSFTLDPEALAYCDVPGKQWRADAGRYEVEIGASSRDLRLRGNLDLAATWTKAVPGMGKWKTETTQLGRNLALGRPVTASSVEKDDTKPENAVDDSMDTRWSSKFSDPQWISVDLGKVMKVNRVGLRWEAAYASAYTIEVSTDGTTWREVYSTEAGQGEEEMITFDPVDARYVRLTGRKRGTEFGYSLFDFAIYGPGGP